MHKRDVSDGEQQLLSGDEQHGNGGGDCYGMVYAGGEPDDHIDFGGSDYFRDIDGGWDGPEQLSLDGDDERDYAASVGVIECDDWGASRDIFGRNKCGVYACERNGDGIDDPESRIQHGVAGSVQHGERDGYYGVDEPDHVLPHLLDGEHDQLGFEYGSGDVGERVAVDIQPDQGDG